MPAKKKRGKGFRFTRKKQHKNPSPTSSSGGVVKKAASAAAKKPPKTPQVQPQQQRADSATSSKRKGKEIVSSALTAPRRVSPRLLAIRTRKMSLENGGSLVPVSTTNTFGFDQGAVTQPPQAEDAGDQNRESDAVDENEENENHRASNNTSSKQNKAPGRSTKSKDSGRGKQQDKQQQQQQQQPEQDVGSDDDILFADNDDDEDEQEDSEFQMFERGTGPVKQLAVARITVTADVKEVEDDYINHAVLIYFCKTGGVTMTRNHVKEWIYNNLGDRETIGSIRYCRDLSRGFFFVYFEHILARRKALASKPQESGLQVIVFPWCSATVNSDGEQCTPRMIVLPGLPDQYLPVLPNIGSAFGSYIGSIGALDPDADLNAVRTQSGWESAYSSTVVSELVSPRIAVMMPPQVKLPTHVELQVRAGVSLKQPIFEQLPHQGLKRGAPGKRQNGAAGTASARKKLKA